MIGKLKDVSVGAWVVLSLLIVSCAAIVIAAPPHFWETLGKADPVHIAGVITLVGGAFVGVFVQWKRGGGPPTPPPPAALALLGVIAIGATLPACGATPVQMHSTGATILAVAAQGASRVVRDAVTVDAQATCPDSPDDDADRACIATLRARWAPAEVAVASTAEFVTLYTEALRIADLAEQGADLWVPLAVAAARVVLAWDRMVAVLRPLGVELPELPTLVRQLAEMTGGES